MGKEGELWDDSALINAFDNAMSKYKKMHGKRSGEATITDTVDQAGDEAVRYAGENKNVASNTETEMAEMCNLLMIQENHSAESQTTEQYVDSTSNLPMQNGKEDLKGHPTSQGADDYNLLLNHYYDLEEKRQKILQQLQQFGSWNYQYSGEGSTSAAQWNSCFTAQEHPIHASEASHPTVFCSCCPYTCPSVAVPCTSCPPCSLCGTCFGKTSNDASAAIAQGNSHALINGDIVKTAMGAAERAISSMKTNASVKSNVNEENKKENEGDMAQSISSETDLTVVLNAWYSAGFYTCKYLMEQSIAKKGHQ